MVNILRLVRPKPADAADGIASRSRIALGMCLPPGRLGWRPSARAVVLKHALVSRRFCLDANLAWQK